MKYFASKAAYLMALQGLVWVTLGSVQAYPASLQLEFAHDRLSQNYGDWNDVNLVNRFQSSDQDQFVLETDLKHHYGVSAFLGALSLTHEYNAVWYQDFSGTFSTDSSVLPGWGIFSELHRKVLSDQSLVLGLGLGRIQSLQPYSDLYALIDAVYYWNEKLTLQFNVRLNRSVPGPVNTERFAISASYRVKPRLEFLLRLDFGKEGYSLVNNNQIENRFASSVETLQTNFALSEKWGAFIRLEHYENPFYDRVGAGLGLSCIY